MKMTIESENDMTDLLPSMVEVFVHYQLPEKREMFFIDADGTEAGSVLSDGLRISVIRTGDDEAVVHAAWGSPSKEGRGRPKKAGWLKLQLNEVELLHEKYGVPMDPEEIRVAYKA